MKCCLFFSQICFTLFFFFSLFTSPCLHFLSNSHPHNHINTRSFILSQDPRRETYLALATSSVSVKRKRCLSWVCRPVFSCAWAWPKNRRPGHSARKAWTSGQDSGLTGVMQLSLVARQDTTDSSEGEVLNSSLGCGWAQVKSLLFLETISYKLPIFFRSICINLQQ